MTKRLALLAAAALAACQAVPATPHAISGSQIAVSDGRFVIRVNLTGGRADSLYHIAFATSEISRLMVGIFDRATDIPSLGYWNDGGEMAATSSISSAEFAALKGVLGTGGYPVSVSKAEERRYLVRTLSPPLASPISVTFTNFPDLATSHAYNVFVCALDSYANVIGYTERDLDSAALLAGQLSFDVNLNHGGLGTLTAHSNTADSDMDPATSLEALLVGTFDTSATPHLGWLDGGGTFTGAQSWFPTLKAYLVDAGMDAAKVNDTRRYLIRRYTSAIAADRTTTFSNLPTGGSYRSFVMAVRDSDVDAGHRIWASDSTVSDGGTTPIDFLTFTTGWTQSYFDAPLSSPEGLVLDAAGNLFVADTGNNCVRKIDTSGTGTVVAAGFSGPRGIVMDANGDLYVTDTGNHVVKKITMPGGAVSTFAGTLATSGSSDSPAMFNGPTGLAIDSSNNLYVADTANHSIRKITAAGVVSTLAGSTTPGYAEDTGSAARFQHPMGIAVDGGGTNVYVADTDNDRIRKIVVATGVTSLVAGDGTFGYLDHGTAASARFKWPRGLALVGSELYVADPGNLRIRQIKSSAGTLAAGGVVTLAGSGTAGYSEDVAMSAQFASPSAIVQDAKHNLYVSDADNNRIRKIQ